MSLDTADMDPSASSTRCTGRFRFGSVELDAGEHSLHVAGHPVQCSRKVFQLLLQLCLLPDRVQNRDELIRALWPGGQLISDEALTQIIFRARAVLGSEAGALVTVRGVGLRLGVPVTRLGPKAAPANPSPSALSTETPRRRVGDNPESTSSPAPPVLDNHRDPEAVAIATGLPAEPSPPSEQRRVGRPRALWIVWLALGLLVVLTATGLTRRWLAGDWELVDLGYGLYRSDLHANDPRSARIIAEALRDDAHGDRGRGEAGLRAVHAADTSTPVPAALLALWAAGGGNMQRAEEWLELAKARAEPLHDVYLSLLLGYVAAEASEDAESVRRQAGAMLDFRPQAWRMRHARAHLLMASGMRAAALAEIQRIEVTALGDRKLEMVIADRASLGDADGAEAVLQDLPEQGDAAYAFLQGRIAWSRGNMDAAAEAFRRAADLGLASARLDLKRRSLVNLAAIEAMRHEDDEAILALDRARQGMDPGSHPIDLIDISLFLAELHARKGDRQAMQEDFTKAHAAAVAARAEGMRASIALTQARLWPEAEPFPPPSSDEVVAPLWQARLALNQGHGEQAANALSEALRRGILDTPLIEEARFLAWQLGLEVPSERPLDPPYPPLSVAVLRRELRAQVPGSAMARGHGP